MSWDHVCDSVCPIARALAVVGDRWTLLILRELSLGVHTFDELQAQTGMSSNLLNVRLKRLIADSVIEKQQYSERPPRYEYHTTEKGKELDPVLMVLRSWGQKWNMEDDEPAVAMVHKRTKKIVDHLWQAPNGGKNFTFDDIEGSISPRYAEERERRRAEFKGE